MIYIVSLGKSVTGGPETLHQLARTLASMGQEVSMYYVSPHINECPGRFKEYGIKAADKVVDSDENILIVPETQTYLLKMFKHIKICIWWLSLDNYLDTQPVTLTRKRMVANNWPKILFPVAFIILVAKGKIHSYRYNFEDGGKYFHTYNCEYAYQYAIKHGVLKERTLYLCGPLNHSFFERSKTMLGKKRENIILFNPKKGREFTEKIIAKAKMEKLDAEFKAIEKMTSDQIIELMSRSKIYMDFGNFPGPERIPREAVTMGVNIITSRNGAAANDIDVPIADEFKFEDKEENIDRIIEKLNDLLENYDKYYPCFDKYRKKVLNQVELLETNAKILLERI
ncbi:MAG: hypothetical protein IJ062_00770 [Firmicutes bacterium]|nr:hypothetical protein [Bacillota bacterium]